MPRQKSSPPAENTTPETEDDAPVSPFGKEVLGGLERGLQVLTAFNANQRQMTLADIARAVDLPRATARRAVNTLEQMGYIASDGRLFRLTPKVLQLAAAYAASNQVTAFLQPVCEALSREFDEDCSAAVLDGLEAVRVAHASPPRFVSMVPGIGFRLPAWSSALGRSLLSGLPDKELSAAMARMKITPLTAHTITEPVALLKEIQSVRSNGYSLVDREAEEGFRSLAVPVRNIRGVTVAAINIGVRIESATPAKMRQRFLPQLQAAARTLEHQLL
ncbi:IclR family transcriptional regulator domain-containing protein [Variovorax sp. VNK109]|jgi:IclR family pca regulon transcriptional regulator|uniref:IclR family transcriptional regulator domain-containing protein n=1 Tax=Variovorax sp. VNK109 TaxID=3400919 RepID=UPI003C065108